MKFVQLTHEQHGRGVAIVEEDKLRLLRSYRSIYELAQAALRSGRSIIDGAEADAAGTIEYGRVYEGRAEWRLLPSFDHPDEASRCLVSGTGLTHKASAQNRDAMHSGEKAALTDSMRMYQWGVEGGRPDKGKVGAQPEWFYKGSGTILAAHGEALHVPAYAEDGGEEPEIAGAYLIDDDGNPWRIGMTMGNEFSDHKMEKRNYLYLAPSKLRRCAIGPELVVGADFERVSGTVRIERDGKTLWSSAVVSGNDNMCHSLSNLEHHHFKYEAHRRPGDVHIHFFGAGAFSFGAGIALNEHDIMEVAFERFGRPLRNPLRVETSEPSLVHVRQIA